jgi:hypothetical protein
LAVSGRLNLDLSGIGLQLEGLPAAVERGFRREWPGFVVDPASAPFLCCRFTVRDVVAGPGPFRPKEMRSELARSSARFEMPEGSIVVSADGSAVLELARELGRREYWTAVNLLRAGLAWHLPHRGAAMLHAAGLIVAERAYLLVGPEGSGKSTWASLGEAGGARVVSDDVVLVESSGDGFVLLGSPLRSSHRADYRPGRWPLAAILFPSARASAAWTPASGLLARSRILANLPFIADAPEEDGRPARIVERLVRDVPCLDFSFSLDTAFLELLRRGPGP